MAREPRDDAWANLTESQLQDLIVADGNSVRNIECRTSICAVELVQVNTNDVVAINHQLRGLGLWGPDYMTSANDMDDGGNKILATVIFALRRYYVSMPILNIANSCSLKPAARIRL